MKDGDEMSVSSPSAAIASADEGLQDRSREVLVSWIGWNGVP